MTVTIRPDDRGGGPWPRREARRAAPREAETPGPVTGRASRRRRSDHGRGGRRPRRRSRARSAGPSPPGRWDRARGRARRRRLRLGGESARSSPWATSSTGPQSLSARSHDGLQSGARAAGGRRDRDPRQPRGRVPGPAGQEEKTEEFERELEKRASTSTTSRPDQRLRPLPAGPAMGARATRGSSRTGLHVRDEPRQIGATSAPWWTPGWKNPFLIGDDPARSAKWWKGIRTKDLAACRPHRVRPRPRRLPRQGTIRPRAGGSF